MNQDGDLDLSFDDLSLEGILDTIPDSKVVAESPSRVDKPPAATSEAVVNSVSNRRAARAADFYFDLETAPDYSRLDWFGLEPIEGAKDETPLDHLPDPAEFISQDLTAIKKRLAETNPPASWLDAVEAAERGEKKPRKGMLDAIEDARNAKTAHISAAAERTKLLSVTPEFCRIVAMGWAFGNEEPRSMVVGEHCTEDGILAAFWDMVADLRGRVIGFNIVGFDLPVIYIRSALLGITPSRRFDLRPWGNDVIDLMQARFPKGPSKPMKSLARFYGLDIPAGEMDGGSVAQLIAEGKTDEVADYVKSDIIVTRQLHEFYRGYFVS